MPHKLLIVDHTKPAITVTVCEVDPYDDGTPIEIPVRPDTPSPTSPTYISKFSLLSPTQSKIPIDSKGNLLPKAPRKVKQPAQCNQTITHTNK